jgi:hypothetical protein
VQHHRHATDDEIANVRGVQRGKNAFDGTDHEATLLERAARCLRVHG